MNTKQVHIKMQSFNGFFSSCLFIVLAHVSSLLVVYESSVILQNASYTMAILVALDTLTGNPIKNTFKKICKSFYDKKR